METIQHINTLPFSIDISTKGAVEQFTKELYYCLSDRSYATTYMKNIEASFLLISDKLNINDPTKRWYKFSSKIPEIRQNLMLDAEVALQKDPAAKSLEEIYLAYPGFFAIAIYRLSHELLILGTPLLPRIMTEYAHSITGVDIRPGAKIGKSFFIDHATGIVIGQTSTIKDNVSIYQGVTLGGLQVRKELASVKRHPTIENNVTIYANATILGGDVIIGKNSTIGANVCITKSIPKNSIVTYKTTYHIKSIQK